MDGLGQRLDHRGVDVGRQLADGLGAGHQRPGVEPLGRAGRKQAVEVEGQAVVEDGAEDGDPERGAHRTAERLHAGGRPQVAVFDRILDGEDHDLDDHAEAQTEDDHVGRRLPPRRAHVHRRQQEQPDRAGGRAENREDLVAARLGDDLP